MTTATYVNIKNENKYLLVRKYNCGHTVVKQFIEWANGVRNYTGASLRGRSRKSHFCRWRKPQLTELLDDYLLVCNEQGADGGHSLWELAAKEESLDGWSPKCDTLFHSFRCDANYWDVCINDEWQRRCDLSLKDVKCIIARKAV